MRNAANLPDRVDVALDDVEERRALLGLDALGDVEAVDVHGLSVESVRDLLALDQKETAVVAVERIQRLDGREDVVIAQDEELIAVIAIPPRDVVRGAVAVAVGRMRVRVALVPASGLALRRGRQRRGAQRREQEDRQRRGEQEAAGGPA